ncbi:MAG: cytochrome c [Pseudomonadota bacterium]
MTRPSTLPETALAGLNGTATQGEIIFTAAGCASCHSPADATGADKLVLAGGQRFPSEFGTFIAPNISPDAQHGIGGWTQLQFTNAVIKGVSPNGQHYFPAFPYTSYNKMSLQDAADLWAYMQTLPANATPSQPHEVAFPFNIRRNLGGWKFLFLNDEWILDASTPQLERGRYLVEALGHCAECHTPRNTLGGLDTTRWMQGAPDPSGKGRVPGITPANLGWVEADITEYLTSGFTPEFDTAGGHMVNVIENTALLRDQDREAIAAYLLNLPN